VAEVAVEEDDNDSDWSLETFCSVVVEVLLLLLLLLLLATCNLVHVLLVGSQILVASNGLLDTVILGKQSFVALELLGPMVKATAVDTKLVLVAICIAADSSMALETRRVDVNDCLADPLVATVRTRQSFFATIFRNGAAHVLHQSVFPRWFLTRTCLYIHWAAAARQPQQIPVVQT
jgi:hypothetical protein